MAFSRQEYQSGLPFPSAGDLPDPGIEPVSISCVSCIAGRFLTYWAIYLFCEFTGQFFWWSARITCCCCSVTKSCPTLCNPMDCSMPGPPFPYHLLELAQVYVHWCHPTISSSVTLFSFCLQSCLASESFPVSQLFALGGQSTGASASASVLPMNIQDSFRIDRLISLLSKGLSRVFSSTTVQMHQFFGSQHSLWSNSHIHTWLLERR